MAGFLRSALKFRTEAEDATSQLPALMVQAQRAVASVLHGEHAQRKSGAGEKFWQYREYVPGDRPQDIDWRQSGKTDRVYIKQKEWQTTQTTALWCSRYAGMNFQSGKNPTKAEVTKVLTLALALLTNRAGDQIGLLGTSNFGRSERALETLGNDLCLPSDDHAPLPHTNTPLPQHAALIQIGDFLQPIEEIKAALKPLSARADSGLIVQVLDPAELELPYNGRIVFEAPSGTDQETINHVPSIRDGYQARIQAHIEEVQALCKRYGWHYALHRTDVPLSETLSAIWLEISK